MAELVGVSELEDLVFAGGDDSGLVEVGELVVVVVVFRFWGGH